jgi:hypothetical protein
MKRVCRILGPILILAGLAACGASMPPGKSPNVSCRGGGTDCRWDDQCCSGRCYVDTGCAG